MWNRQTCLWFCGPHTKDKTTGKPKTQAGQNFRRVRFRVVSTPHPNQKQRQVKPTGKSAYSTGVLAKNGRAKHSVIARIAIEILAETDGPAENNLGGGVSGTDFSLWNFVENWKS